MCGQSFCPLLVLCLVSAPPRLVPCRVVRPSSKRACVKSASCVIKSASGQCVYVWAHTWLRPPASLPALTILCSHACSGAGEDSRQRGRLTRDWRGAELRETRASRETDSSSRGADSKQAAARLQGSGSTDPWGAGAQSGPLRRLKSRLPLRKLPAAPAIFVDPRETG